MTATATQTPERKLITCGWCGMPATREFEYTPHWLVDQTKTVRGYTCSAHDPYPTASRPFDQQVTAAEWWEIVERKRLLPPDGQAAIRQEIERFRAALTKAAEIIERADARCLAADGPVGHVREEMTDAEWRELYLLVKGDGSG